MDIRRVVTGHDAQGRAVFVSDEAVPALTMDLLPGNEFHRLWGADEAPTFPDDGSQPDQPGYFPTLGGYRFATFVLPPGRPQPPADLDVAAALEEAEAKVPGLLGHMEPDHPGMHTTDTVDFEVVMAGEVVLELDDGAERTVRTGDTVVQNGTRHRWSNRGTEPAVIAVFMVGAHRKG